MCEGTCLRVRYCICNIWLVGELEFAVRLCVSLSLSLCCMCGLQTSLGQMREMRAHTAPVMIKKMAHIFRSQRCSSLILTLINDQSEDYRS